MTDDQEFIDALPWDTTELNISCRGLDKMPDLSRLTHLKSLDCSSNYITSLGTLSDTITDIYCSNNNLTTIPPLRKNVRKMVCSKNKLTSIPPFNDSLEVFYCFNNCPKNFTLEN